jgi:chorismate-pyruvate lyase
MDHIHSHILDSLAQLTWYSRLADLPLACPTALHTWLHASSSLTAKLQQLPGAFFLKLLQQRQGLPDRCAAKLLNINNENQCTLRDVALGTGSHTLVIARSVIPEQCRQKYPQLAALDEQPLGHFLFSQAQVNRGEFQFAVINNQQTTYWARRSVFYLEGCALLVQEVFFPRQDLRKTPNTTLD